MRRVSKAICELSPKYIEWPTGNKIPEVALGFSQISGFPDIIGAIDSIHIKIHPPKENAENFLNRKGHHSIHVQVISILFSLYNQLKYMIQIFTTGVNAY